MERTNQDDLEFLKERSAILKIPECFLEIWIEVSNKPFGERSREAGSVDSEESNKTLDSQ